MWWLKPLFDRIPLYVLSRAVFGDAQHAADAARAAALGLELVLHYLTWRRLSPHVRCTCRSICSKAGAARSARAPPRVGRAVYGVARC